MLKPIGVIFVFLLAGLTLAKQSYNLTVVTGLWNIGRSNFSSSSRGYDTYLNFFKQLLQYDGNMIIFGTELQQNFTQVHRPKQLLERKTLFVRKQLADFEKYWYTEKIWWVIKNKPSRLSKYQAFVLMQTPQYGIRMYNPVVMSKHRLLYEASTLDTFSSQYLLWLDGGFTHMKPFDYIQKHFYHHFVDIYQPGWFLQTQTNSFKSLDIGFANKGRQYSANYKQITTAVLGNWLGGRAEGASTAYHIYQNLLRITLQNLDMNTDQSVFILLAERYPYFIGSIKNSRGEAFYNLSIQVQLQPLAHRHFNWDQDYLRNFQMDRDQSYTGRMEVISIVDVEQLGYFIKWRSLYAGTFARRLTGAIILAIIYMVACKRLSKSQ